MFSNVKQSIPEVFVLKMRVDKSLKDLSELFSEPKTNHDQWNLLSKFWEEARQRQTELRMGCEKFIANQKLTGNHNK